MSPCKFVKGKLENWREIRTDLLADALDDSLDVHLSEAEDEEGPPLPVLVVPTAGEVLTHHRRLLVLGQDLKGEKED